MSFVDGCGLIVTWSYLKHLFCKVYIYHSDIFCFLVRYFLDILQ